MRRVIYIVVGLILFNFIFATGETTSDKNIQGNQNEKNIMNDSNDKYNVLLIENENLKKEKQKLDSKISEMKKVGDYGILYNVDQYYNNAWLKLIVTLSVIGGILGAFQWKGLKEIESLKNQLEQKEKDLKIKIETELKIKEDELNKKIKESNDKLNKLREETTDHIMKTMEYSRGLIDIKNEELKKDYNEKVDYLEKRKKEEDLKNEIAINELKSDIYQINKNYGLALTFIIYNLEIFLKNDSNLVRLEINIIKLYFNLMDCKKNRAKITDELKKIKSVLTELDKKINTNDGFEYKNKIMQIIKEIEGEISEEN